MFMYICTGDWNEGWVGMWTRTNDNFLTWLVVLFSLIDIKWYPIASFNSWAFTNTDFNFFPALGQLSIWCRVCKDLFVVNFVTEFCHALSLIIVPTIQVLWVNDTVVPKRWLILLVIIMMYDFQELGIVLSFFELPGQYNCSMTSGLMACMLQQCSLLQCSIRQVLNSMGKDIMSPQNMSVGGMTRNRQNLPIQHPGEWY